MPISKVDIKSVNIPYPDLVNLYDCILGEGVFIGPFVEIQSGVIIGDRTRISSHSFIPTGVTIASDCFIGHGVMFTNDKFSDSSGIDDWVLRATTVGKHTRIGSNATILPVSIGEHVIIGAGTVVTRDVADRTTVFGRSVR